MILDLFSHKIHSSGAEWPDKLAELASIFGEFDGKVYDRQAFEDRLKKISPRASYFMQSASTSGRLDASKFRDEISAYPAYLGLYFLEQSDKGWVVRVSETAKRFLLCEEPDVASFLRLQLPLFQYPNAMGAAYISFTNNLRIQANTRDRTLSFVEQGIHLSPVRLIAMALKADSILRQETIFNAVVTYDEIFGLVNSSEINSCTVVDLDLLSNALFECRTGNREIPTKYESRFHILRHLEIFSLKNGEIRLRDAVNVADATQLSDQLDAICNIKNQFNGFDGCTSANDLESVIASGDWGRYFDGVKSLSANEVEILSSDVAAVQIYPSVPAAIIPTIEPEIYSFRERTGALLPVKPYNRRKEIADPESTRIKMQRRNLVHKELIDKMDSWLRNIGAIPKENDHIDLYAKIPNDGSFIFEMKSGGVSLLDQIRKGLSQLYEYRYRYKNVINDSSISLCLVLSEDPAEIPWITDYLCNDREINICWFSEDGQLAWPQICENNMLKIAPLPS